MAARTRGGDPTRCPSCGAALYRHKADDSVPFNAVIDLTPLTPTEQQTVREPNRLVYCLTRRNHGPPRLYLQGPRHPADCTRDGIHVTEHRCPPAEPTTLF